MSEDLRIKLLRMVTGQVRSYIADHPDHFAPYALSTAPHSLAKRIAHELVAKGLTFDKSAIHTLRRSEEARQRYEAKRPFEVAFKKRRRSSR